MNYKNVKLGLPQISVIWFASLMPAIIMHMFNKDRILLLRDNKILLYHLYDSLMILVLVPVQRFSGLKYALYHTAPPMTWLVLEYMLD